MTLVLVRDDDANATTDPERLARAFAPLLDAGIPVNLSVIPEVALDTRAPDGVRERFLDPDSPDEDRFVPLTAASPLAAWLRRHDGAVDVFVHGLTHRRVRAGTEFGAASREEARVAMRRGRERLTDALGRSPAGFVAPWDALSAGAVRAATELFALTSTAWVDRSRLPLRAWAAHYAERLARREVLRVGDGWIVRHRGGRVTPDTAPDALPRVVDDLTRGAAVAVVVLHHWMFWAGDGPHPVIRALATALRGRRTVTVRDAVAYLQAVRA